jgi:CPA2 family monovalent cation:H+ antiporter-2
LAVASILGYGSHRLGLSPIVGYLLAGIVVGPHTPGFVANKELADQLSEIGVILLMFGVGLQFHFKELLAVRRVAIPGAVCQSLVATGLGCIVAREFGWSWSAGLVFGMAISVASTVVLLRVLTDNHDLHTPTGHIAVGWLVVEDLFTVLVLVLLPVIFGANQTEAANVALALAWSVAKLVLLMMFTFFVGSRLIPWLLSQVAATRSRELFMLSVLVVALGIAVGAAKLFDASMALGAFLAGMVVGRSEFSLRAASEALPMRDAFAVLFFVSVGMLFDPRYLWQSPGLVASILGIILIGKPLAALGIVLLLRYLRVALSVAVALAQIGEFSFILAALGKELGILTEGATNTLIAAAIVSISLNPILYRLIDFLEAQAKRHPRVWNWLNVHLQAGMSDAQAKEKDEAPICQYRAIVVGYGPVGRTVAWLLRANEIEPTIVELNLDTVRRLRSEGVQAVYGDATHRETLKHAGVEGAVTLILSAAGMYASQEAIRLARELNPKIRIFARAAYLGEISALRQAGADAVFSGEGEVASVMTEFILRQLGATPEQVDRERDRIRMELFGGPLSIEPSMSISMQTDADSSCALNQSKQSEDGKS